MHPLEVKGQTFSSGEPWVKEGDLNKVHDSWMKNRQKKLHWLPLATLSTHPSIHLSICLDIYVSIYLDTYVSIYLDIVLEHQSYIHRERVRETELSS